MEKCNRSKIGVRNALIPILASVSVPIQINIVLPQMIQYLACIHRVEQFYARKKQSTKKNPCGFHMFVPIEIAGNVQYPPNYRTSTFLATAHFFKIKML